MKIFDTSNVRPAERVLVRSKGSTMMSLAAVAVTAVSIAAAPALAQDNDTPINTERPSISASPIALSVNRVQIEAGYEWSDDLVTLDTAPNLLFRYGLADDWELQLGWVGQSRIDTGLTRVRGSNDVTVGLKRSLTDDESSTAFALFASVSLPTGNRELTSGGVDPSLGVLWTHDSNLSWFGTTLLTESDGELTMIQAVGFGVGVTDKVGAYLEYAGEFADNGGPAHTLYGGLSYMPSNNIQWDVYAGSGLNDRARDLVLGAGLSVRY